MSSTLSPWTPESWRHQNNIPYQIPEYTNQTHVHLVQEMMKKKSPLVFAGECRRLENELGHVWAGQGIVLMGGDCAETFRDFSITRTRDDYFLLLRMKLILTHASGLPVTLIARTAGQFAKPRSVLFDDNGCRNYQGDIINGIGLDEREPDPERMLHAYHQSVQTLNLLRAFQQGGISNIQVLHDLNHRHIQDITHTMKDHVRLEYLKHLETMEKTIDFIRATTRVEPSLGHLYTGHECLLLPYEESLTRVDSTLSTDNDPYWYDTSAHFLWLGERTRKVNGSHVEFLRGIRNPIGIKVSASTDINELLKILELVNPTRKPGRVMLISRMGAKSIPLVLPTLVRQCREYNVVWVCDPMHANTFTWDHVKTRSLRDIHDELRAFFQVMRQTNTHPGGVHLEMTSSNVTECVGGSIKGVEFDDLQSNYESLCDPRLNAGQAFETAFVLADLFFRK